MPEISDITAYVLHEARQQLHIFQAYLGFAMEDPKLESETTRLLTEAKEASDVQLQIFDNSLDLAKLDAKQLALNPTKFDIKRLAESIINNTKVLAKNKQPAKQIINPVDIKLIITPPNVSTKILLDELRLRQILTNLLSNARKFTQQGSITLTIDINAQTQSIRCNVTDTGNGMDEKISSRIFTPYTQADATIAASHGGTGLGLSISEKLVALMKGSLTVKSKLGEGSSFGFEIPCPILAADEKLEMKITTPAPKLRKLKILIADDNTPIQMILKRMLQQHELVVVANGSDAVQKIQQDETFDLVLMDTNMPIKDGPTAIKEIRQFNQNILIISLSANADNTHTEKALSAGANGCLSKPYDRIKLETAIANTLGKITAAALVPVSPPTLTAPIALALPPGSTVSAASTPADSMRRETTEPHPAATVRSVAALKSYNFGCCICFFKGCCGSVPITPTSTAPSTQLRL